MRKKAVGPQKTYSATEFTVVTQARLAFIEDAGFHRAPELEKLDPFLSVLVYRGDHVAFVVDLDVRDQTVGMEVVMVRDGRLADRRAGGYSELATAHLLRHGGLRTAIEKGRKPVKGWPTSEWADRSLDYWVQLFQNEGRRLLRDAADTLPESGP